MSKWFLLIYDGVVPTRQQLIGWLDEQPPVANWHASPIPNVFVVVWEGSVVELRDTLHSQAGLGNFLVIEAGPETFNREMSGWPAKATIDFLREASTRSAFLSRVG